MYQAMQLKGWSWLLVWFLLNVTLTLLNKQLFSHIRFPYPIFLSLIHMLATAFGSGVLVLRDRQSVDIRLSSRHILFSILFTANILVGNIALQYASVNLVQLTRCAIPAVTVLLSMLFMRTTFNVSEIVLASAVVAGSSMSAISSDETFNWTGFGPAALVCILSAMKTISSNALLRTEGTKPMTPAWLLFFMSPLAVFQLLGYGLSNGEIGSAWNAVVMTANEKGMTTLLGFEVKQVALLLSFLFCSGLFAFLLNVANFNAVQHGIGPLTFTIAGNVKHAITIALAQWLFGTVRLTPMNVGGIIATLVGATVYTIMPMTSYNKAKSSKKLA